VTDQPSINRDVPGWDSLAEDIFGLNVRAARSISALISSPRKIFDAARDPHWVNRAYTPSIRLFLSIVTFSLLLRVFWAGPDSHMGALFEEVGQVNIAALPPEIAQYASPRDFIDQMLIGMPIALMLVMLPASFLLRIWGKGTPAVVRLRLYFLAAVPGYVISFLLAFTFELLPAAVYWIYLTCSTIPIFLADWFTAFRGGVGATSRSGRVGKSFLFAVTNFLAYVMSSILMSIYASFMVALNAARAAGAA